MKSPLEILQQTAPQRITEILKDETPRAIALALQFLEPPQAAAVISLLPVEKRTEVAIETATMEQPDAKELAGLEQRIKAIFMEMSEGSPSLYDRPFGGIDELAEIMISLDPDTSKELLTSLESRDPELAEELKQRILQFEDLMYYHDKDVQAILRKVEYADLARALKGASPGVIEKIEKNMSEKGIARLKEDMEAMGPQAIRAVGEAQQKIVQIAMDLEAEGEIIAARPGDGDMFV